MCGGLFAGFHRIGLDLSDAGFLWYGAQQTALGRMPLLDFQAYDPGRYVWTAAFIRASGSDGFATVLLAATAFQALAIFVAIATLRRCGIGWCTAIAGAALLAVWMFPDFRFFDHGVSILLTCATIAVLARPTVWRAFALGAAIGLAAYFGRNHGMYGLAVGSAAVVLTRFTGARTPVLRLLSGLAMGIVAGYLPMLWHVVSRPGFLEAMLTSIALNFERGAVSLPLATPWPWVHDYHSLPAYLAVGRFMTGAWFLVLAFAPLATLGLCAAAARTRRIPPLLLGSAICVPPYVYYAFSRPDPAHLSSGIMPLLLLAIGAVGLKAARLRRAVLVSTLVVLSLPVLAVEPHRFVLLTAGIPLEPVMVLGDRFEVDPYTARLLRALERLERERFEGDVVFAAPILPWLYATTRREAPTWTIYFLSPSGDARERDEIARLARAHVRFAVLADMPLDGRDELRLSSTHPDLWRWLAARVYRLPGAGLPPPYRVYRLRSDPPTPADPP